MNTINPGYHIRPIIKGQFGKFSKIQEEFVEILDAIEQGSVIMVLTEISDLLGAMLAYYTFPSMDVLTDMTRDQPPRNIDSMSESFNELAAEPNNLHRVIDFLRHILSYLEKYNLNFDDAILMANITKRAFINGRR